MFLTDVHIPEGIATLLEEAGHEVQRGSRIFQPGATDETIGVYANAHALIVISCDQGFGDVRRFPPETSPGVVILRPDTQGIPSLLSLFRRFLLVMDVTTLRRRITVVEPDRIRRYPPTERR